MEKPSFGKSLEEHLTISGREIAFPIEACVTMLLECGMQEEVSPNSQPQPWQHLLFCHHPHQAPKTKHSDMGYSLSPAYEPSFHRER